MPSAVDGSPSIHGPYRSWLQQSADAGASGDVFRIATAHDEWNHLVIPFVAMARGFFRRYGLSGVEIIATGREEDQIAGLAEGWIDVGVDPLASLVLAANARGEPVYIGAARRQGYTFFLCGARGIERIEDLRGKRVILAQPGGVTTFQAREMLRRSGLEPDRDVSLVFTGVLHDTLRSWRALDAGEGEAVMQPITTARQMEAQGYPILVDGGEFFRPRHDRIMAVAGAALQRRPEQVTAAFQAMMDAAQVVLDRQEAEYIRSLVERCGFPTRGPEAGPVFDSLLDSLYFRIDPLFDLPADGLAEIVHEAQAEGLVPADFDPHRALRLEALQRAQQASGTA
jgi:ABC-type nitrate/sulfonate/bicarbonate transport system substrate-binding protein